MKGLYQRGGVWWYRWTPAPGIPQQRLSTGETDEVLAIARARELRAKVSATEIEKANACDTEVDAYIAHLKRTGLSDTTCKQREFVLHAFVREVDVSSPRYVSLPVLRTWFDRRRAINDHTAVKYLCMVRCWLEWLLNRRKISGNPAKAIELPKLKMQPRRRFLRVHEAQALLEKCKSPRLKFAIYCGLHAGMRKLEVVEARPEWFDLRANLIHIDKTDSFAPKDREARTIPLTDEFATWLRSYYGLKKPFMLSPNAERGRSVYRFDFRQEYETYKASLGLADITFHDLRRTFASLLVSKGVSIYKVAKWLGDGVEIVQETYGHLIPQDDEINASWI